MMYYAEYFVTNNRNHEDETPLIFDEGDSQEPAAPTPNSKETRKTDKNPRQRKSLGRKKKNTAINSQLLHDDALTADNIPSTSATHISTPVQSILPSSVNKERLKSLDVFRG